MYNDKPILAISGDSRAGKDTIAGLIRNIVGIPYVHSTSYAAALLIWADIQSEHDCRFPMTLPHYETMEELYADRVNHRRFWADWIDNYNRKNQQGIGLYLLSCSQGNQILTGIRKTKEILLCQERKLVDLTIWVHRPGNPRDSTQEYGSELCDIIIENQGLERTIEKLHHLFGNTLK